MYKIILTIMLVSGLSPFCFAVESEWFDSPIEVKDNSQNSYSGGYKYSIEDGNPDELWGEDNERMYKRRRAAKKKERDKREKKRRERLKEKQNKTKKITVPRITFPMSEYNRLNKNGTGVVKGKIRVLKKNGEQEIAASSAIYLNPVTSYSEQWYEEGYVKGVKLSPADGRLFQYMRFTSSDKDGNYRFDQVPQGQYFITCEVDCKSGCGENHDEIFYLVDQAYAKDSNETEKNLIAEE